jgi:hypothetical protein
MMLVTAPADIFFHLQLKKKPLLKEPGTFTIKLFTVVVVT